MERDGARILIDGMEVAKTGPPFAQVCGSPGNAMRYDRGSIGLRAGNHKLHVEALHFASDGAPRLFGKARPSDNGRARRSFQSSAAGHYPG